MDVVTKLVEMGAEWPHGKLAAAMGNDVVAMLVEACKGVKKLQVSLALQRGCVCSVQQAQGVFACMDRGCLCVGVAAGVGDSRHVLLCAISPGYYQFVGSNGAVLRPRLQSSTSHVPAC